MQKKILYIATSDIHIHTFHIPYLKWLKEKGVELHLAVENRGNLKIPYIDHFYYIPFPRTPFSFSNIASYKKLKELINGNKYDLIHCHTPVPSVLTRLAARKARKNGTKILYTAHGFHFYNNGPFKNWLIFYPIEWVLSVFTDGIVTINDEDFRHINGKMWHKNSYFIKGIGIDTNKFHTLPDKERTTIRQELGYNNNEFILLYVAEFIFRKNHQFIIEALPELIRKIATVKVVFAGKGILLNDMKTLADKLGVANYIDFLGYISDVDKYASIADIGISSSRQEGLGLGLAEEMLCSVPVVATEDRGHKEMIIHGENGYMFKQESRSEFIKYISELYNNKELRLNMGVKSFERAQLFRIENSLESMALIYRHYLNNE